MYCLHGTQRMKVFDPTLSETYGIKWLHRNLSNNLSFSVIFGRCAVFLYSALNQKHLCVMSAWDSKNERL